MLLFRWIIRVRNTGIDRTDFRAFGRIIMTHAFDTLGRVDDVDRISLADGINRALRFTGTAANALI